jgi:hypothetical protein
MKKMLFVSLLMWSFGFTAQADIVDFKDNPANIRQQGSFTSGELTFTVSDYIYTWGKQPGSYNGTTSLIAGYGTYPGHESKGFFSFKETDGSIFSLSSLDAGTTWYSTKDGGSVDIIGHQSDGGILTQTLDLFSAYQTFMFDWSNLLYVDVMPNSKKGYIAFDNIDVSIAPFFPSPAPQAVPITAAVWLFGSALSGLIGLGARRQSKGLIA